MLHLLPTLWFRNTWSWAEGGAKPVLQQVEHGGAAWSVPTTPTRCSKKSLSDYYLYCEGDVPLLFTENETNNERLFGAPNAVAVCQGRHQRLRRARARRRPSIPPRTGTKAAAHYRLDDRRRRKRRPCGCG